MKTGMAWVLTLAVQALVLGGLVAREERALLRGAPVVLEVRAVDPMDLLSGRYVSVPLAISRIMLDEVVHSDPPPPQGVTVYVRLEPAEDVFKPAVVTVDPIDAEAGIWARAQVVESDADRPVLLLDFGVSRFYISESARDPSRERRADGDPYRLTVAARIAADGRVTIEDLLVDGESYAVWNARPAD